MIKISILLRKYRVYVPTWHFVKNDRTATVKNNILIAILIDENFNFS